MGKNSIQDILPFVEHPSHYLGMEINRIKKDPDKIKLSVALAFPDLYEIGTSHFGIQILYYILNRHPDIAAERVFAPGVDMAARLRSFNMPLMSLESHKPLNRFDIIGFSLLYELNFTNILNMLDLANIPFYSRQRDDAHPVLIAGGPCACNPEPVADFFDAIVVGDGENTVMEMANAWLKWKKGYSGDKEILLKMWSKIEGVYVPSFFEPKYDGAGFQTLSPNMPNYRTIRRAILNDLDGAPFPDSPIIPFGKPVHDRLRIEVSRGCTRGCRFCQAGMIYRPVRERSLETILSLSDASIASTGYDDLSLLSLSTGDYGCIVPLMECLMARYQSRRVAVSFPSLRAGTLTPELMNLVKTVRKTGFTIAPEAGSQRLRNVINKNIGREEIFDTVRDAFQLGWRVIKLYFMVGLPTETDDDLRAIVKLVKDLREIKSTNRKRGNLNVSVTTFIPKSHTPFQWASQIPLSESKEKIQRLRRNLKLTGIQFKWQNPEVSLLEGLWARGDRRLGRLLVTAYRKGCIFDGWSDKFNYGLWEASFIQDGVDVDYYTTRIRDISEPLPWDHIDARVAKDFLKAEWDKALTGTYSPDCRKGDCNTCGVCDFETVEPKVFEPTDKESKKPPEGVNLNSGVYKRVKISYAKRDAAKFFGHLELSNIIMRAIRRAGIPVKFSEGFHPKPKLSFEDPLPVGLESLNETFYLTVSDNVKPRSIMERLNDHLPGGLEIIDCRFVHEKSAHNAPETVSYRVSIKNGVFDKNDIECFIDRAEFIVERPNRKGRLKRVNLKEMILHIELLSTNELSMTLKREPGKTIRPFEVVGTIFNLHDEQLKQAKFIKVL